MRKSDKPKINYAELSEEDLTEVLKDKMSRRRKWAEHGLLTLYDQQTPAEREDHTFHESNGVGFSSRDQQFLSSLASQRLSDLSLTETQIYWLFKLLPKYSGQLARLIRSRYYSGNMPEDEISIKRTGGEEEFIPIFYFIDFDIDSNSRTMSAITGNLELIPSEIPDALRVSSPSGDNILTFRISRQDSDNEDGSLLAVVYTGEVNGEWWKLFLVLGDKTPEPEETKSLGRLLG